MIDSHAHLHSEPFKNDIETVIQNAINHGVSHVINIGTEEGVNGQFPALDLALLYPNIYATIGIHPHDAKLFTDEIGESYIQKYKTHSDKIVGIGEIGLDFYYEHSDRLTQLEVIKAQMQIAVTLDLPVSVHCRSADFEMIDVLTLFGDKLRGIMHCFNGSDALLKTALDLGYYISISGMVTFQNATSLRDMIPKIPMDRLLIETDAPFLAPVPKRGVRNEPKFLPHTAQKIAEIYGKKREEIDQITTHNTNQIFRLPS